MQHMKSVPFTTLTIALAAVFAQGFDAHAEEAKSDTVTVTASRVEQDLQDVNMSVSVITADQIKHSSAKSVGEILEDVPGVRINNDGGQGIKRVSIRGEDAFRTLVMIDGQKIAEHKSMSGSPLMINPADIERIEVIKGPASVFYGSDAIGGAINIITKKGADKPFTGTASFGYNGSSQGTNGNIGFQGGINGWKYRLSAGYEHNNELRTPEGHVPNTYFDSRNVGGALSYDINKDWTVGAGLDYYRFKFGSSSISDSSTVMVDVPKWERTKVNAYTEGHNLTSWFTKLRADAFYQKSKKDMINTVTVQMTPIMTMRQIPFANNDMDQYGVSLQADFQLGKNNYLVAGYELNYDKLNADSKTNMEMISSRLGTVYSGTTKFDNYDGYQMSNAVFAAMETTLPADFTLNYGVRYTYVQSDMDLKSRLTGEAQSYDKTHDGKAVFNAGLTWRGVDDLALRFNYAQGYRFPILQHLYVDTNMGQMSTTYSNPDLKPETSDNFELGARWMRGGVKIDTAVFFNTADDYISTLWNAKLGGYQYQNVAKAKTFGWETDASFKLGDTGFEPYGVVTVMRRQFKSDGFKTWDSATPAFFARYGVKWAGTFKEVGLRGDLYARSTTKTDYKTKSGSDDYHLGGATTLNFTAGVDFGPKKMFSLDAGLYNIFDKSWKQDTSIYEPGRYFAAKLTGTF
jgi:hemoglobin/transferrin/lactoferrin receptor protein